jgi:hypothetical protein
LTPLDNREPGAAGEGSPPRDAAKKKADLPGHLEVSGQVGLLVDGPPGRTGLPFIQSSDDF